MGIKASEGFEVAQDRDILISEHISEIIEKASLIIEYVLVRACWTELSPEDTFDVLSSHIRLRENVEENDGPI